MERLTMESDTTITPDTERTRALSDLLAADGVSETAYTRTLLFAYEWINGALSRHLAVGSDTDGQS